MNLPFYVLLAAILLGTTIHVGIELLNLSRIAPEIPEEMREFYDSERYRKSQDYLRANTRFGILRSALWTLALAGFIAAGGFELLDRWARSFGRGEVGTGLIFVSALGLLSWAFQLPGTIWHTFVIEERFGFNQTRPRTFVLDQMRGLLLGAVLGGAAYAGVLAFFAYAGPHAWLGAWVALTAFQLLVMLFAPVVILPLFNKFEPLPEGELRSEIETFSQKEGFRMQGIFTMDGSKRSSKANAFFTGFGGFRRIVLFDTLIRNHPMRELVAVLAHEIGHSKLGHIPKQVALSIASTGAVFYLLSIFLHDPRVFAAFRVSEGSVHAGLILFGILYSPISQVLSLWSLRLSRKYEFEADAFAARTYGHPEELSRGLRRLASHSLANLRPHPLKVWTDYTHPPVLDRVAALRSGRAEAHRLN